MIGQASGLYQAAPVFKMSAAFRRRLRLPVISRLTFAWAALFVAGGSVVATSLARRARPEFAFRVPESVETVAHAAGPAVKPAETPTVIEGPTTESPITDGPALRDGGDGPTVHDVYADLASDALEQPADAGDDVVITIDGAAARSPDGARAPTLASLSAAPTPIRDADPALETATAYGKRPTIGRDGRRAADVYARPFVDKGQPKTALIVGGLGLNPQLTARAIDDLPPEVTLAFAPYARNLAEWGKRARAKGHEVMIELPMEAPGPEGRSGEVLGPAALLTGRADADNLQRLDWILSRLPAAFGATNYLGAKFSNDPAMRAVLARLNAAGLAYIDDTGAVPGRPVARLISANDAARDLDALTTTATRDGAALGKVYVSADTIDAVGKWAAETVGAELAPASAVIAAADKAI